MRALHLHEEVLLLALRDEEGTMHAGAWADNALGAALLAELLLDGAVRAVEEKGTTYIEAAHPPTVDDELLRKCHGWVAGEKKRWSAADWVQDFAHRSDTRPMTAASLVRLGVLKADEGTVLWIFKRRIYPELDPEPEARISERLLNAIYSDSPVEPRTAVLLAVAHRTGLLEANFPKKELAERQARIDAIIAGDYDVAAAVGAAHEAIEAAQEAALATSIAISTAIFASVIVPTVINR